LKGRRCWRPNNGYLQILPRRRRVNGKRVHAAREFARQCCIYHAMALEAALPAKGVRYDIESEMRFAARPVPGMSLVPMRFILDIKALGRESVAQLFRDQIVCVHGMSMNSKWKPVCSEKIMLSPKRPPSACRCGQSRACALLPPVKS